MKTQLILFVAAFALSATPALAGPLGDINREVGKRQDRTQAERPAAPRAPTRDYRSDHEPATHDYYTPVVYRPDGSAVLVRQPRRAQPHISAPFALDLFASYQNVAESDGSLAADIRLSHGNAALGWSSSSYFESDSANKGPGESSRLTRWEISVQGRALKVSSDTTVWLGLGIGRLHGSGFEAMTGGSILGQVDHTLTRRFPGGLGVRASARGMMYEDDINGGEYRAGFTASVLYLGYRHFELNVGPALKGPEAGISLHF